MPTKPRALDSLSCLLDARDLEARRFCASPTTQGRRLKRRQAAPTRYGRLEGRATTRFAALLDGMSILPGPKQPQWLNAGQDQRRVAQSPVECIIDDAEPAIEPSPATGCAAAPPVASPLHHHLGEAEVVMQLVAVVKLYGCPISKPRLVLGFSSKNQGSYIFFFNLKMSSYGQNLCFW